jgi:hypothetical protein
MRRLTNETELIKKVVALVGAHMQPHNLNQGNAALPAYLRLTKKLQEAGVDLPLLAKISQADKAGSLRPGEPRRYLDPATCAPSWDHAASRKLLEAHAEIERSGRLKVPVIQGRDLIALGVKPGVAFSAVLKAAFEAQMDHPDWDREQLLEVAVNVLRAGGTMKKNPTNPTMIEWGNARETGTRDSGITYERHGVAGPLKFMVYGRVGGETFAYRSGGGREVTLGRGAFATPQLAERACEKEAHFLLNVMPRGEFNELMRVEKQRAVYRTLQISAACYDMDTFDQEVKRRGQSFDTGLDPAGWLQIAQEVHLEAKTAWEKNNAVNTCERCGGSGMFVTRMVNGRGEGPGGPCYRCNGKGHQNRNDRRRNCYYDRFGIRL